MWIRKDSSDRSVSFSEETLKSDVYFDMLESIAFL
jgi:hypothetical protein